MLFKHGTIFKIRIKEATKLIIYRTFLLAFVMCAYMIMQDYSASIPVKSLMLIMFIVLVSPIQIIVQGFSFRDVGFEYLHRIYGEYQRNFMVHLFTRYDILRMLS